MTHDFDRKLQGEVAELAFAQKVVQLGLRVSKPYGERAPYDFIVDCRGRITRVQVKSVSVAHSGAYRICSGHGRASKRCYTTAEIDLLAAYVVPHNAWYLIPVAAFARVVTIKLRPHRRSRGRFEMFREAWDLLRHPKALTTDTVSLAPARSTAVAR